MSKLTNYHGSSNDVLKALVIEITHGNEILIWYLKTKMKNVSFAHGMNINMKNKVIGLKSSKNLSTV